MLIQINYGDVQHSDSLDGHVTDHVNRDLKYHTDRVTRVEVHLRDDNAHKSGANDCRCTMEARIAGSQPIAVDETSDDLYKSITVASQKLGRAVKHHIDKHDKVTH